MVIGAFMPSDESAVIRVAAMMKNARSFTDWLRARFDDLHPVEQGIKPAPPPLALSTTVRLVPARSVRGAAGFDSDGDERDTGLARPEPDRL